MTTPASLPTGTLPANTNINGGIGTLTDSSNLIPFTEAWNKRQETISSTKIDIWVECVGSGAAGIPNSYRSRPSVLAANPVGGALYDHYKAYLGEYSFKGSSYNSTTGEGDTIMKLHFLDPVEAANVVPNYCQSGGQWKLEWRIAEQQVLIGSGLVWADGSPYTGDINNYLLSLGVVEIKVDGLLDETSYGFGFDYLMGYVNASGIAINNFWFNSGTLLYNGNNVDANINISNYDEALPVSHSFTWRPQGWDKFWRENLSGTSGTYAGWDSLYYADVYGTNLPVFQNADFTTLILNQSHSTAKGSVSWASGVFPDWVAGYTSYIDSSFGERHYARLEQISATKSQLDTEFQGVWSGRQAWYINNFGHIFNGTSNLFPTDSSGQQGLRLYKVDWNPFGYTPTVGPNQALGRATFIDPLVCNEVLPDFGWKIASRNQSEEILIGSGLFWSDGTPYVGDTNNAIIPVTTDEIHIKGCYSYQTYNPNAMTKAIGTANADNTVLGWYLSTNFDFPTYYPSGTLLVKGINVSQCWCEGIQGYIYPTEVILLYRPQGWNQYWNENKTGGADWDILYRLNATGQKKNIISLVSWTEVTTSDGTETFIYPSGDYIGLNLYYEKYTVTGNMP
jgi:hypothetical protein